jgi:hypothetical protein
LSRFSFLQVLKFSANLSITHQFSCAGFFLQVVFKRIDRIDQVTCRAEGTGPKADHRRREMVNRYNREIHLEVGS